MKKTTLRKIISGIDFTNKKLEDYPDWTNLSSVFNINLDWSDDTRLKSYFIKVHLCTDSFVGIKAYFLDGEFVAVSNRNSRKCPEEFEFISTEIAEKMKNYLVSLLEPEEYSVDIISCLDEDIPNT
jgi:hypothetical protein